MAYLECNIHLGYWYITYLSLNIHWLFFVFFHWILSRCSLTDQQATGLTMNSTMGFLKTTTGKVNTTKQVHFVFFFKLCQFFQFCYEGI